MSEATAARWRRAADVVDAALDASGAAARDRVVRERCAGDAALEADVRRWLAAVAAPAPLFDGPPAPPAATLPAGAAVGPWRVARLVGAGGMGAVYEAERDDGAFAKRVAVKVAPALGAVDRALLERRLRRACS